MLPQASSQNPSRIDPRSAFSGLRRLGGGREEITLPTGWAALITFGAVWVAYLPLNDPPQSTTGDPVSVQRPGPPSGYQVGALIRFSPYLPGTPLSRYRCNTATGHAVTGLMTVTEGVLRCYGAATNPYRWVARPLTRRLPIGA